MVLCSGGGPHLAGREARSAYTVQLGERGAGGKRPGNLCDACADKKNRHCTKCDRELPRNAFGKYSCGKSRAPSEEVRGDPRPEQVVGVSGTREADAKFSFRAVQQQAQLRREVQEMRKKSQMGTDDIIFVCVIVHHTSRSAIICCEGPRQVPPWRSPSQRA